MPQEQVGEKPQPFLTIKLIGGDVATRAVCPELGFGIALPDPQEIWGIIQVNFACWS